jgi:hypothetical protein
MFQDESRRAALRKDRFTIARLMAFIVLIAGSLAAMKDPTDLKAHVLFNLVLALLSAGLLAALFRAGAERAFWAGFSLFGWVSLVLTFAAPQLSLVMDLRDYLYYATRPRTPGVVTAYMMPLAFSVVFDSLACAFLALTGGVVGLLVRDRRG